ncbi:hypothetical protein Fmac_010359 [Flemingia macrophylla]|uniref:C2 domain-containing protein n=1 Tax=Flemingia macrophylla TaxID=520843 RepID=A0ABD1MK77_9FABA
MACKSRTLELTVLSVEGLRVRGRPSSKGAFAVVRAESLTSYTTAVAVGNNGVHWWNEKFAVELGAAARSLTFEVKCKTGMPSVRDVAVARIALSDFLGGVVPDHCLQFLCYRLRDWDARECGIVNFSVRLLSPPPPPPPLHAAGVVTGVPVWWNSSSATSSRV